MKDNEIMVIQGEELQIKEWNGKRVVTFKDIDTVHKRPIGTASRNFNQNRQRFISGVDFFKVPQNELPTNFVDNSKGGNPNINLTLITETGYLMLVKSFNDDLAWRVQRELVEDYFRPKTIVDSGETSVVLLETEKIIRCAEIMAGCLKDNRMYVINCLRHIVPDIDKPEVVEATVDSKVMEVPVIPNKTTKIVTGLYSKPFNHNQFNNYLIENEIKQYWVARKIGCSVTSISKWGTGAIKPKEEHRIKFCLALGLPVGYFDNSKRTRRIKR